MTASRDGLLTVLAADHLVTELGPLAVAATDRFAGWRGYWIAPWTVWRVARKEFSLLEATTDGAGSRPGAVTGGASGGVKCAESQSSAAGSSMRHTRKLCPPSGSSATVGVSVEDVAC